METKEHNVLMVQRNSKNAELLNNALKKYGLNCFISADYDSLDSYFGKKDFFDIVLMDITGFDVDIWERCKKIQQQNIPLLVLSSRQNTKLQQQVMRFGVSGIMTKPVILRDFVKLIFSLINNEPEK